MKFSIRTKLFVSFLPLILLPLVIVGIVVFFQIQSQAMKNYASSSKRELRQFDHSLMKFFNTAEEDIRFLANTDEFKGVDSSITSFTNIKKKTKMIPSNGSKNEKAIYKQFIGFINSKSDYDYAALGTDDGGFIYYPTVDRKPKYDDKGRWIEGYVPSHRGWYKASKRGDGKFVIPETYVASNSNEILLSPGIYFKKSYGKPGYVLSFDINLSSFTKKVGEIVVGEGGHVIMVETRIRGDKFEHVILADPKIDSLKSELSSYFEEKKSYDLEYNKGKQGYHYLDKIYNGQLVDVLNSEKKINIINIADNKYYCFKLQSELDKYTYFSLIPLNELYSDVFNITIIIVGLIVIFIVIMIFASFFVAMGLSTSVRKLDFILVELSEGEGDLTASLPVTTRDEIGDVSKSLNLFLQKLRSIVTTIKNSLKLNMILKNKLANLTNSVSNSTSDISIYVNEVETRAANLDRRIEESASSIEQITRGLENLDQLILQQSTAVQETSASVTEMASSLKSMAEVTHTKKESVLSMEKISIDGGMQLQDSVAKIKGINNRIDDIIELTELINNISAQTNLLAMNAAIEAAHAGEAGKGFAVVAEEIRKLAESSSDSAKAISATIEDIVVEITSAANSGDNTMLAFTKVQLSIKDVINSFDEIYMTTQEIASGGKQISETTDLLNNISSEVKIGSTDMKDGLIVMESSMSDLKNISSSVHTQTEKITNRTIKVMEEIHDLKIIEENLSDSTNNLQKEVDRFKT